MEKLRISLIGKEMEPTYNLLKENNFKPFWEKRKIWETGSQKDLYAIYIENVTKFSMIYVPLVHYIKKIYPESKVLFCGPYANQACWETLFYSEGDFVCSSGDEETILDFCQKFNKEYSYSSILGLGYKAESPRGKFQIWIGNKREPKGL